MKHKRDRVGALCVGLALLWSNLAIAQPATAQFGTPDRVKIEYVAPNGSGLQGLYQSLKDHQALEKLQKILSPLRLSEELAVKTIECGKVNAWYRRENSRPTVTICYELLNQVLAALPKETTASGISPEDAKTGQLLWLALHEVGHATFDILGVSIFGNEEVAADNFASYVMLQFAEARRLILGAAWKWSAYVQNYKMNPVVQVRLAGFASDHGLPQERFYNVLCMAFGADPVVFADLVREGYLPATRAANCPREYIRFAKSFEKVIGPHIDYELAKGIVGANWIPPPALKQAP
jgi:hypothetical protein